MLNKDNTASLSDEEAEATAAASREEGTNVIRNHLDSHLALNPNSSYVSWIATLHPENAHVTIDPRFFIPNNPWWTVYEEGKATLHVTGVTVDDDPEQPQEAAAVPATNNTVPRNCGGLVAGLIGFSCCLTAVLVAFSIELSSALIYLMAVGIHFICKRCSTPKVDALTVAPFCIFWFILQVFRYTDALLLLINVGLVELLAGINWMLCGLFALDCAVGKAWHQHTRRLSHHTRWAFRVPFRDWDPPRVICCRSRIQNEDDEIVMIPDSTTTIASDDKNNDQEVLRVTCVDNREEDNVIVIHHEDIIVDSDDHQK